MRVGLIGAVGSDAEKLGAACGHCIESLGVDALFHLGAEATVTELLAVERQRLHAPEFTRELWEIVVRSLNTSSAEIFTLARQLQRDHAWLRLETSRAGSVRRFSSLHQRRWVLCQAREQLSEHDQENADVIALGGSPTWWVETGESKVFVAPGPLATDGWLVIDDTGGLRVDVYDPDGVKVAEQHLALPA